MYNEYVWCNKIHCQQEGIRADFNWVLVFGMTIRAPYKGSPSGRNHYSFYSMGQRTKKLLLNAKFSTKFRTKFYPIIYHISLSHLLILCATPSTLFILCLTLLQPYPLFFSPRLTADTGYYCQTAPVQRISSLLSRECSSCRVWAAGSLLLVTESHSAGALSRAPSHRPGAQARRCLAG
jgi:hypothetical protein